MYHEIFNARTHCDFVSTKGSKTVTVHRDTIGETIIAHLIAFANSLLNTCLRQVSLARRRLHFFKSVSSVNDQNVLQRRCQMFINVVKEFEQFQRSSYVTVLIHTWFATGPNRSPRATDTRSKTRCRDYYLTYIRTRYIGGKQPSVFRFARRLSRLSSEQRTMPTFGA